MMRLTARPAILLTLLAALLLAAVSIGGALALFTDTFPNGNNAFTTDTIDPPTGLTAAGGSSITLDWTATVDTYASGHRVLRATASGGPYTQIAEVTPRTTTTYVDTPASGTYYYVVRAFFQSWESANSNEASATVSAPVSDTFVSVADSYVDQNRPTTNFGTTSTMEVRTWATGKNERSFTRFDTSSIPAGSTIDSATLTLCATTVPSATRTYDVHRVTASWVETTLTWNNQPAAAAVATATTTTPAAPGCMTWNVTADVQAWVDGMANNGWLVRDAVEDDPKDASQFRTREDTSTPTEQPQLDVTYTPP